MIMHNFARGAGNPRASGRPAGCAIPPRDAQSRCRVPPEAAVDRMPGQRAPGEHMGVRVAVAGASGYAGGELLRLIAGHPDLELGPVTAGTNAGAPVTALHPHLPGLAGLTFTGTDPDRLASADLVFLALHHEESARVAARLPAQIAVIDLSASFRLPDPGQWASFYPGAHAGRWVYGLPELPGAREQITAARRVAAPGCHAT